MKEYTCVPNAGMLETGSSLAIQAHWISEPKVRARESVKNKQANNK